MSQGNYASERACGRKLCDQKLRKPLRYQKEAAQGDVRWKTRGRKGPSIRDWNSMKGVGLLL